MMRLSIIAVVDVLKFICCVSALDCDLGFILVVDTGCICPGQMLTLECTVIGWGTTVLRSTVCANNQEIALLHSRHNQSRSITILCNDGAIQLVGRILKVQDDCFTSQLQIKSNIESQIRCEYDNGVESRLVGNYSIPSFDTIDPLPPPSDINWERVGADELLFSWSPVVSNCSSIHYNILDSNCGSCPNSTTDTNITCTNVSTSHFTMCILAIQTVICGNISGEWSSQVYLQNADHDMHSLSLGAIIAVAVSCVVVLLGMALILFGLAKKRKRKSSQPRSKLTICAPVVNTDSQLGSETQVNHQPKPAFHCDLTNDTRGYTLCQSDYDQITVPNSNYSHLDYTQCQDLQKQSQNDIFRSSHSLDTPSINTGCIRVEDESLDLESLLAKLQGRVSTRWFQFGLAIGVPKEILKQLRCYPIEQCLVELLDYWLRYHPDRPTWKELADAIEDIQDYELASSILRVYDSKA